METGDAKEGMAVRWFYGQRGTHVRDAAVVKVSAGGKRVLVEWQDGPLLRQSWVNPESIMVVSR